MTHAERDDDTFANDGDSARWMAPLARIAVVDPLDLDAILEPYDSLLRLGCGRIVIPSSNETPLIRQNPAIGRPTIARMVVGTEVADPRSEVDVAAQLAVLAVERECDVVVVSDRDLSGFERFRVERLVGDTDADRSTCLQQIRDFWQCNVVL